MRPPGVRDEFRHLETDVNFSIRKWGKGER